MYEEKNNSSKQVLLSVLAVAILVVAVVGVSFAFFTYSKQGEKENVISTGTLVFSYNETTNGIQLTNALPIDDESAIGTSVLNKDQEYFDFDVTAEISGELTIDYEIAVEETTDPDDIDTLDSKYVKVMLKGGTTDEEPSAEAKAATFFNTLDDSTQVTPDNDSTFVSKTLYTSSISKSESHHYRFYMWLANKYNDGKGGTGDTEMSNDVCHKNATEEVVACDDEQFGLTGSESNATLVSKGTNGKTFKVKISVTAKDQA